MNIVEIPTGYAELNDDGTWVHHPYKFKQAVTTCQDSPTATRPRPRKKS